MPVARRSLEDLAVELYARGLLTRDIEDAFRDESRRLLSRAAMSEITERLWAEYEAFARLALTYKSNRLRPKDLLAALAYSGKGTIKIGKLLQELGCAGLVGSDPRCQRRLYAIAARAPGSGISGS